MGPPAAFPPGAGVFILPFPTQGLVPLGVSLPVALFQVLATAPLYHLTPDSNRYRGSPFPSPAHCPPECCSSSHPLALPGSVAVTWPFSRSLSAAPASPPQNNDAIAATPASGPSTCDSHRREAARGPTQRPMGFLGAGRGVGGGGRATSRRAQAP